MDPELDAGGARRLESFHRARSDRRFRYKCALPVLQLLSAAEFFPFRCQARTPSVTRSWKQ
jgi:hypothetical protein